MAGHAMPTTLLLMLWICFILLTAVGEKFSIACYPWIAFVGANSFAHHSLLMRINSHLQNPVFSGFMRAIPAFVGANSFAHHSLLMRINSPLQNLCFFRVHARDSRTRI